MELPYNQDFIWECSEPRPLVSGIEGMKKQSRDRKEAVINPSGKITPH
jgi:hypothetical protein